ncbi:MAG: hypothetical protein OEY94_06355 [Alphaproteobacteria bacterium]|nr:hypothetical protein [Alphaproteobacteria bacterium]
MSKKSSHETVTLPAKGGLVEESELVLQMLDIERQRIASEDRKTETARMMIQMQDDSDKRQFEFHMKRLEIDDRHTGNKHDLAKKLAVGGGFAMFSILVVLLGFAFLGNPQQSKIAMDAMKIILIGGGGWGVVSGLIAATKKLLKS